MFRIVAKLKQDGITIIYISHRIEELFRISDRVTVMRDGRFVKTLDNSKNQPQRIDQPDGWAGISRSIIPNVINPAWRSGDGGKEPRAETAM